MIVLDASAVLEVLLRTPPGQRIASRIADPSESLHAPHLLDLEVVQVLRRYLRGGSLSERRAADAIEDLADLDIERHSHHALLPRIWALRSNATAYDAAYLALAEALPGTLLTRDRRLAATTGVRAPVEVV